MPAKSRSPQFDVYSAHHYRFTHGHAPKGIGAWSFSLGRGGAWTQFQYSGSYTEAKAAAMREARSLGCEWVVVNT